MKTMKKTYIAPTIEAHTVGNVRLMQGSLEVESGDYTGDLGQGQSIRNLWSDEDEDVASGGW